MATGTYFMYKDNKDEWRWRFRANNNEIIGVSSEGYIRRQSCVDSIDIMKGSSDSAVIDMTN